jgi:AcrR family transcriptional regulator
VRNHRPGRRRDILDAFTSLVAAQGYDMTSVAEIAEHLQLSKGTIMYHFGSKDQLLRQMSLDYMQRRMRELELIVSEIPDSADRLSALIVSLITSYRDDRDASVAFSREFMRFASDPVMDEVRALRRQYADALQGFLEAGMADGTFRELDAKIVALQIVGMCNWTWTWLNPAGRLSFDEVAEIYASTMLSGVLARAGSERAPLGLPDAIVELRRREERPESALTARSVSVRLSP